MGKEKIDMQKKIVSEIRPLVGYPIAFIVVSVIPLILRIYEIFEPGDNDNYFYTLYVLLILWCSACLVLEYPVRATDD